jgi:hypothetical protein
LRHASTSGGSPLHIAQQCLTSAGSIILLSDCAHNNDTAKKKLKLTIKNGNT